MVELVKFIVMQFVPDEGAFTIVEAVNELNTHIITIALKQEDMGKVIGKQGKIAKSIRTIVRAAATDNIKYVVEIVEKV